MFIFVDDLVHGAGLPTGSSPGAWCERARKRHHGERHHQGGRSTFQTNFQQWAISAFKSIDPNITVNYDPVGSGTGRTELYSNTVQLAG